MRYHLNSDGDFIGFGSSRELDFYEYGTKLLTGAYAPQPLPENKRAVLRYFMEHPKSTMAACQLAINADVSSLIYDLHAVRYIERDGKHMTSSLITVTLKGRQAYHRNRITTTGGVTVPYEPYVSPKSEYVRSGGEDAMRIKSKGAAT